MSRVVYAQEETDAVRRKFRFSHTAVLCLETLSLRVDRHPSAVSTNDLAACPNVDF